MKTENFAPYFIILGLMFAASLSQLIHYYPDMPEVMAQKYDFDGNPYRYGSKNTVMALLGGLALLPLGIFSMVYWMPLKVNNIPNQDYWMQEENQPRLKKILMKAMFQLCTAMSVMLLFLSHAMLEQNLTGEAMSSFTLIAVICFTAFVPIWIFFLVTSFRKTEH